MRSSRARVVPLLVLLLCATAPAVSWAEAISQADIDALERDLAAADEARRDELLPLLMEGLLIRCFPDDRGGALAVARDDWSRTCLQRAEEVAGEIVARPAHPDRQRALFVSGRVAVVLQKPRAGAERLERFLTEFPGGFEAPRAHHVLAELAWKDGDHAAAAPHYRALAEALEGAGAAAARYRLAWCLHESGDPGGGANELADALAATDGLDEASRATARRDLLVMLIAADDPALAVEVATRGLGADGAADAVEEVAGALMGEARPARAAAHFGAAVAAWPAHPRAAAWRIGAVDAAFADTDHAGAAAAIERLIAEHGAAGGGVADRSLAAGVEEASRSGIARLHESYRDQGAPTAGSIEALYRAYLAGFPTAAKAPDVRIALAALLDEAGRGDEAIDEMLAVVADQRGRERGAQAARIAMERIVAGLDEVGEPGTAPGPLSPLEARLVTLAETFCEAFPRHSDNGRYLTAAGALLAWRGEVAEAERMLLAAAQGFPTATEAPAAAALALEIHVASGRWADAVRVAEVLTDDARLTGAQPQLAAVLARTRWSSQFQQATAVWEAGDPAAAAPLFDAVAGQDDDPALVPMALINAASCLVESGSASRAPMLLRRVYTQHPDHELAPAALEQEAYLRYERADATGAASLYRQLADRYADHERAPFALSTAAALYDQEGVFDEAIACYRLLLQRYPDVEEAAGVAARLEELGE